MPRPTPDPLVLRSLYLPTSIDDKIRMLAYQLKCGKSDVIRYLMVSQVDSLVKTVTNHPDDDVRHKLEKNVRELGGVSDRPGPIATRQPG